MTTWRRFVSSLLFVLAVTCSCALWVVSWDADEFQVFRVAADQVHGADGVRQYFLLDQTSSPMRFGVPPFHSKKLGLTKSVWANYALKNLWIRKLPDTLILSRPSVLVSSTRLEGLYSSSARENNSVKNLRSQIGKSYGVVTLSRVGFDTSHTHAVIYAQLTYCGLCGGGYFYYLEKQDGAWKVKSTAMTWIS